MDSYELNKIAGAFLFTGACLVAVNIIAGEIYAPQKLDKPSYEIAVEVPEKPEPAAAPEAKPSITALLANASIDRGKSAARKCVACHTFEKGGANKVGPNLWDTLARPIASHAGFNYSSALQSKKGNWTVEDLDAFIASPRGWAPGTSMAFAGVSRARERADLIAYLNSLSDNPAPLPTTTGAAPPTSQVETTGAGSDDPSAPGDSATRAQ